MHRLAFSVPPLIAPRAVLRPPLRALRGAGAMLSAAQALQGRGQRVAFLPSAGREGAALLRIYHVAEALRTRGWRTFVLSPTLTLMQRRWLLAGFGPDVIVMQGARHVLNRPALYPGVPIVYDLDDADFHLAHLSAPVTSAMGQVAKVIAGSRYIADWARRNGAKEARVIWTGTTPGSEFPPQPGRGRVIAWAQTRPMTYSAEAALVRRVMAQVVARLPGVTLRLYDRQPGDDPAFAESFRMPGLRVEWCEKSLYRDYVASFETAAVGLAPLCPENAFSRGKSFGKVLAYLDRGVPVVGSDAGEHGAFFTSGTGVITNDAAAMSDGVLRLLEGPAARQTMAEAARKRFLARLTLAAAARRTDDALRAVIAHDATGVFR